jgi:hypothetical protein
VIQFIAQADGVRVEQWCEGPTVYLDHWAWRRISEDPSLAQEFAMALARARGTLAMSWLNLIEFAKVTDTEQRRKADALLDQILPSVFFVNLNFFSVIGDEDRILGGGVPEMLHSDLPTLRGFAKLNLLRPDSLQLLPPQQLFRIVTDAGIVAMFEGFAASLVRHIRSMQKDYAEDPGFRRAVRNPPRGLPIQRGTRYVAREIIGAFFKEGARVNQNDAVDTCHVVVPVAYCDFVLLDGRWLAEVEKARARFTRKGMSFPMAEVFSERKNGLKRFLEALAAGARQGIA